MTTEHFKKLERMYLGARLNQEIYVTTEIQIEPEEIRISMEVTDKFHHALGAMHGSVYFKLLDDAAFFAASALETEFFLLTTSFQVDLLRPFVEGKITAHGRVKHRGRGSVIAESRLLDAKGRELAFGSGRFARSKVPLSEDIGYK